MIIGFGYKAGVGKTTSAKYLRENYGFEILSFAAPLKDAVKEMFSWTDEHVYGSKKLIEDDFWGVTPGRAMQLFGTELMRQRFGQLMTEQGHWPESERDNFWLKAAEARMLTMGPNIVFDDVRFPNEADAIRRWGGIIVKIHRDPIYDGRDPNHPSETSLDGYEDWDWQIQNTGTVEELYEVLETIHASTQEATGAV
jgi:hypothetical protein